MRRPVSALGLMLLLLAGCGGGGTEKGCSTDVADASGLRLTYRAAAPGGGAPQAEQVRATADRLCRRLEGTGDERPAIAAEGDRISVVVPKGTPPAFVDYLAAPGRIAIYDWEPVILDERCRRDPNRNALARSPVVGFERARQIAERCGRGARVVRQERVDPKLPEPDAWWVVRGEPVLEGHDVVNPRANTDAATGEPIVEMEFTPPARRRFTELTRKVALRGADNALPGALPATASHHFAIVLDDELVSVPFIDYVEHPDGFGGENGAQIAGGFSRDAARVLARVLDLGPLPLQLELLERP